MVDGKVAFTGGINVSDVYAKRYPERAGDGPGTWRETQVQITGPAVAEFQRLFIETPGGGRTAASCRHVTTFRH